MDAEARAQAGSGTQAGSALDLADAVGRAQQGDTEAFRLLYRDIQPRLLRYLHAIAGQDAEDIASETWLQVTRDLPGFTGTYDGFRGWVATIARHRALDHLRRVTRRPRPWRCPPRTSPPGPPPPTPPRPPWTPPRPATPSP